MQSDIQKIKVTITIMVGIAFLIILMIFAFTFMDKWIVFLLLILFSGPVLFFAGFHQLHEKRIIENLPMSKIRSLSMGLVKIKGKIVPTDKVLVSPIKKEKCVYYDCNVEQLVSSGKSSSWISIFRSTASVPFYVQDETGKIPLDLKYSRMNLHTDNAEQAGIMRKISPEFEEFLTKLKVKRKDIFGMQHSLRFKETFLAPGDNLYIIGNAGQDNSSQSEKTAGSTGTGDLQFYNYANYVTLVEVGNVPLQKRNIYDYKPEVVTLHQKNHLDLEYKKDLSRAIINKGHGIFLVSDKEEDIVMKNLAMEYQHAIVIGFIMTVVGITGILIYLRLV